MNFSVDVGEVVVNVAFVVASAVSKCVLRKPTKNMNEQEQGNVVKPRLENWSAVSRCAGIAGYVAAEQGGASLNGDVYGHPLHADGKNITTSRIVGVEGVDVVLTRNREYTLGVVAEPYERLFPNARERLFGGVEVVAKAQQPRNYGSEIIDAIIAERMFSVECNGPKQGHLFVWSSASAAQLNVLVHGFMQDFLCKAVGEVEVEGECAVMSAKSEVWVNNYGNMIMYVYPDEAAAAKALAGSRGYVEGRTLRFVEAQTECKPAVGATPETDAEHDFAKKCGHPLMVAADFCRRMERERDDLARKLASAGKERDEALAKRDAALGSRDMAKASCENVVKVLTEWQAACDELRAWKTNQTAVDHNLRGVIRSLQDKLEKLERGESKEP